MSLHKRYKVLIVDDEHLIRQGIKHVMNWEAEGFQIVGEATNGREALDLIENLQPHIVITDMVMPVMDGEELTKVIKMNYPHIEIIILSSFGDFDYVRATFQLGVSDYILKPKLEGEELLKALQHAASKIPGVRLEIEENRDDVISVSSVIEKIMAGFEMAKEMIDVSSYFSRSHYCLLGIDFKLVSKKRTSATSLIIEQFKYTFTEVFPNVTIYQIKVSQDCPVFLLNFETDEAAKIKIEIKKMSASYPFANLNIGWVLTESFMNLFDLKAIYEQKLLPLMRYRFYLPTLSVIIFDEVPAVQQLSEPFQLTKFTESFQHHQFESAFLYLETYVEKLSRQYTKDELGLKSFLGNIIFNIATLLGNMAFEHTEIQEGKYEYIASIDEAATVEEAITLLQQFLDRAKEVVRSLHSNQPNMQRLLDYIHEHYAEPLNLTDMGKKFHYNPSYLSNYFSDHHYESFSEYLKQIRIRKAIELLRNEEVSIAKISSLVGYSDHSYFCRVFKKEMGMSPSSYRRQFFNNIQ